MREKDKEELEKLKQQASSKSSSNFNLKFEDEREDANVSIQNLNLRKIQKEKNKKEKQRRRARKDTIRNTAENNDEYDEINNYSDNNVDTNKEEKHERKKKEKTPFSFKKFIIKIIIMIIIASFICILLFYNLDKFIYNLEHSDPLVSPITGLQKESDIESGILIDSSMDSVQYSYNNKYYTFLKDGRIYIYERATNKETAMIAAAHEICYYNLLYDKNLIVYITKEAGAYSTDLQIWTYEFSSKKTSEYNEFSVSGFNKIKDMEYSPIVNIIYLNVERTVSGSLDNVVYRIDLFNNMSRYASNMIINKMVMLKQRDGLYFQEDDGTMYYRGYPIRVFNTGVDLIGLDLDDNVFFINEDRTKVYIVSGTTITNTIEITDTNVIGWYSDNTNVYLIYPDYVVCISSKTPLEKLARMSQYMTFQAIKGDTMYLKTNDGRVITTKLNVK